MSPFWLLLGVLLGNFLKNSKISAFQTLLTVKNFLQLHVSHLSHDNGTSNFMKESGIRKDILESAISSYNIDNVLKIYKKSLTLNRLISKEIGKDVIFIYKRASNILLNELKNKEFEISGLADPGLFKNQFELNLFKKIQNIRKDFTNIGEENNYVNMLKILSSAKKEVNDFFENVIVNDEEKSLKKNRLELLQMLCKTFDNYFNFSKVESGT